MWRNPAERPAMSSYDTFLKYAINAKQKTFIKKLRLKQASYFQRFFSYFHELVVQRVSAWPSSGSICAYPCSVITSPILINDTTTTH